MDTRITVIDKIPAANPQQFVETMPCMNLAELSQIIAQVPPRLKQLKIATKAAPIAEQVSLFDLSSVPKTTNIIPFPRTAITVPKVEVEAKTEAKVNWSEVEPVKYIQNHWNKELSQPQGLFAPYQIEGIKLSGCQSHPTDAVESIAMASIQSPSCSCCPNRLSNREYFQIFSLKPSSEQEKPIVNYSINGSRLMKIIKCVITHMPNLMLVKNGKDIFVETVLELAKVDK